VDKNVEKKKEEQKNTNMMLNGEILGSHGSKYEDDCLLGCCAM
jgi:hypothetical protein